MSCFWLNSYYNAYQIGTVNIDLCCKTLKYVKYRKCVHILCIIENAEQLGLKCT